MTGYGIRDLMISFGALFKSEAESESGARADVPKVKLGASPTKSSPDSVNSSADPVKPGDPAMEGERRN
jgi:hypothetical protein